MVNHGEKIKRQQYTIQILTCFLAPKELPASADIPGPSLELQSLATEDTQTESLPQASQSVTEGEVSICSISRVLPFSYLFLRRIYEKKNNKERMGRTTKCLKEVNRSLTQSISQSTNPRSISSDARTFFFPLCKARLSFYRIHLLQTDC